MAFSITLPENVKRIIRTLETAGFEAYAVGGCVRDALLNRVPQDWDITTSALPEEVKRLFPRTVDTGIEHGTVTVMRGQEGYEVTTYRIDGTYEDFRHPDSVTFTRNLGEDLLRRDFTINAMAYNESTGLVDLFDGMKDLQAGIIRAVGNPTERFSEDALRILRAVRFAAQLGFTIEPATKEAMKELSGNLKAVSAERIREELTKLLSSEHPEELFEARALGITADWLPEWDLMCDTPQENVHHIYDVARHTTETIHGLHRTEEYQNASPKEQAMLNYTMLLHDSAKPQCKTFDENGQAHFKGHAKPGAATAREVLRRLKFDNETIDSCTKLVYYHDTLYRRHGEEPAVTVRFLMNRIGTERMPFLFAVFTADAGAKAPQYLAGCLKRIELLREAYRTVVSEGHCVNLKMLAVNGADLMALGYPAGPELGEALNSLLEDVLLTPEHNTKEYLLEKAKR